MLVTKNEINCKFAEVENKMGENYILNHIF